MAPGLLYLVSFTSCALGLDYPLFSSQVSVEHLQSEGPGNTVANRS